MRDISDQMSPDKFGPNVRSYIMSRVRSKGTKCERMLRAELIRQGIDGFKMHYKLVGTPDFAFPYSKVAIFCDSEFWHGLKPLPVSNRRYWSSKINYNVRRDRVVTSKLRAQGWMVLRLRESAILSSPMKCVDQIKSRLKERKIVRN